MNIHNVIAVEQLVVLSPKTETFFFFFQQMSRLIEAAELLKHKILGNVLFECTRSAENIWY